MEDYNSAYYDAFEAAVAADIAVDESSIGEIDSGLILQPCENCPLMDFPISETAKIRRGIGAIAGSKGLEVTMQFTTSDGRSSKNIVLGYHGSNSIGSKRQAKLYADAAARTKECKGPKRVPKFLGPLALKKCPALKATKNTIPRRVIASFNAGEGKSFGGPLY